MEPILKEGLLVTSSTATKRSCARIIENMCKLVDEFRYLESFTKVIEPLLLAAKTEVADPECRNVCGQAHEILVERSGRSEPLKFNKGVALAEWKKAVPALASEAAYAPVFSILASISSMLNEVDHNSVKFWTSALQSILVDLVGLSTDEADKAIGEICSVATASRVRVVEEEEEDDAEVLCDLPFGLAYGNKVLLRKTHLKLKRGHKYGLVGQNDSGKTSLLRAIADYQIEGFSSADEMRCVFVETDIKTELADLTVLEYMYA